MIALPPCEVHNCGWPADWVVYPDHRRKEELAVSLCDPHHEVVAAATEPKGSIYRTANAFIKQSLLA